MAVISLIEKAKLEEKNRLDAEYYQAKYMRAFEKIEQVDYVILGDVSFITDGQHGYFLTDETSEIRQITAKCIKNNFVDKSDTTRLSKVTHDKNLRSSLQEEDILLSRVGTIGNAAIVTKEIPPANIDQNVTRIKIENTEILNPWYLSIFLNSYFGRIQVERRHTSQVQKFLPLVKVRELKIPIPTLQNTIANLAKKAYSLHEQSKTMYNKAEKIYFESLGFRESDLNYRLWYVKNLSNTLDVNRLDAEYFQLAYDEAIKKIQEYSNGYAQLLSCVESVKPNFDPTGFPDRTFSYVELADIDTSIGIIQSANVMKGKEAPSRAKRVLRRDDVIVSSVEGSLEKVALVDEKNEGSLASTGFFQFRPIEILPEVLLVLSKTALQIQLKRECVGTILAAVPKASLKRILIPVLPHETQEKIASLVRQSHAARWKTKEILEEAKRKVEETIEKS